jgi:hypothetical protein
MAWDKIGSNPDVAAIGMFFRHHHPPVFLIVAGLASRSVGLAID